MIKLTVHDLSNIVKMQTTNESSPLLASEEVMDNVRQRVQHRIAGHFMGAMGAGIANTINELNIDYYNS